MPLADYSTLNSLWFYHLSQNFFSKIFFCCAVITEEEELFLRICCHGNVAASVHIIYNDMNFLVFLLRDREDDGKKYFAASAITTVKWLFYRKKSWRKEIFVKYAIKGVSEGKRLISLICRHIFIVWTVNWPSKKKL